MGGIKFWLVVFLAVAFSVSLPLALTFYVSQRYAEQAFRGHLDQFTHRALDRAELVVRDSVAALREIARFKGAVCSDAHLRAMKNVTLQHRYVRELVFFGSTLPSCSSLSGGAPDSIPPLGSDWRYLPGYQSIYSIRYDRATNLSFLNLRAGHHVAVIDTRFYSDIVPPDGDIRLGVVDSFNGNVLSAWPNTDPKTLESAFDGVLSDGRYYDIAFSHEMPVAVVAYEPVGALKRAWIRLLWISLPVALLVSLGTTWLLLRKVRQLRGPGYALHEAVRRREFEVHYQPIIKLDSEQCVGAEALIRWRLPDGSLSMPDSFMSMAESLGLVKAITDQLIDCVLDDLGPALAANRALHVSLNLAPEDLETPRVHDVMQPRLERAGVLARQIWFEITERGFVNTEACRATIKAFRKAGHPVYIDDFGTGYSSLAYLQDLDVDGLKIDKSFVDTVSSDAATNSVAPHIIQMAQALNIKMVAEGIETKEQKRYLRGRGVQFGQGWLFAKAMPPGEFLKFAQSVPQRAPIDPALT